MTELTPKSDRIPPSLWESKPWWCQPWTIILTGLMIIAGSWWLFHTIWLTLLVAVPICLWWTYFLIIVPRLIANSYTNN
jgi:hypothetical protein